MGVVCQYENGGKNSHGLTRLKNISDILGGAIETNTFSGSRNPNLYL